MSVLQFLGDILHDVYSEWLDWKDLSRLDVACVGKDRELWLTSLGGLKMRNWTGFLPEEKMTELYAWLSYRQVLCVEDFPVTLGALQNLVERLNLNSYCPAIRSIQILDDTVYNGLIFSNCSELRNNLSIFLSHCHGLQGVTVNLGFLSGKTIDNDLCEAILGVLNEIPKDHTLVQIDLKDFGCYDENPVVFADLLRKHASSLQNLHLTIRDEMDDLTSILHDSEIHLKVLDISVGEELYESMESWLLAYLSSGAGLLLETLELACFDDELKVSIDGLLPSIASSCPKLKRLVIKNADPCSTGELRLLYELSPHLQHVSIDGIIGMNEKNRSVTMEVKGSNEDWAVCLCYALRRSQYKQATLQLLADHYHPVDNLKSMLEPYQLRLDTVAAEGPLMALLQDLPHLNHLFVPSDYECDYTNGTLVAIIQHHASLTELDTQPPHFLFGDRMLSKLIQACQSLKILAIPGCGVESLKAISKHPNLREVRLKRLQSVSKEILDKLLLDEEVKWPVTLEKGYVLFSKTVQYSFNKASHRWVWRSKYSY